jgi:hypothetical protein
MSAEKLDPIDPDLGSLFVAERTRGHAPAASKARVLERLDASIATGAAAETAPAAAGAAGASLGAKLVPIVAAFVVGGAVGGAAVNFSREPRVVYVDRPVPVASVVPPKVEPLPPTIELVPTPPVEKTAPSASAPQEGTLAAERAILDVARSALARGDGAHALEAADRHGRAFPRGQMAEEREAIAVQALVKLERLDEARARGTRFRTRYPNSVLGPVIDAALAAP